MGPRREKQPLCHFLSQYKTFGGSRCVQLLYTGAQEGSLMPLIYHNEM